MARLFLPGVSHTDPCVVRRLTYLGPPRLISPIRPPFPVIPGTGKVERMSVCCCIRRCRKKKRRLTHSIILFSYYCVNAHVCSLGFVAGTTSPTPTSPTFASPNPPSRNPPLEEAMNVETEVFGIFSSKMAGKAMLTPDKTRSGEVVGSY